VRDPHTTFDSILDLCRDKHRRIVLGVLVAEQQSVTLNDITETVLKYNSHASPTEASGHASTEIRKSLHHHHFPMLASEGLISYDPDRERVEATEQLAQAQPTLSAVLDADPELEGPVGL